jgi:hypothetical protein
VDKKRGSDTGNTNSTLVPPIHFNLSCVENVFANEDKNIPSSVHDAENDDG